MASTSPKDIEVIKAIPRSTTLLNRAMPIGAKSKNIQMQHRHENITTRNTAQSNIPSVEGRSQDTWINQKQPFTIDRIGAGSIVGLASLLRAEACEEVSASSELVIASIEDKDVLELYKNDKYFQTWCDNNVWLAETYAIIDCLTKYVATPKSPDKFREQSKKIHENVKLLNSSHSTFEHINDNQLVVSASANIDGTSIGELIDIKSTPNYSAAF